MDPELRAHAGSTNYPGVAPLPTAPQVPSYRPNMDGMGPGGGVYRDELGVQYGLGTGTTIGGIGGVTTPLPLIP